jgi:hypothetical protein
MHLPLHLILLLFTFLIISECDLLKEDKAEFEKEPSKPDIKIITGAYINTIPQAIIYEGSAVIKFKLDTLPPIETFNHTDFCNGSWDRLPPCRNFVHIKNIYHELRNILSIQRESLTHEAHEHQIYTWVSSTLNSPHVQTKRSISMQTNMTNPSSDLHSHRHARSIFPSVAQPFNFLFGFATDDQIQSLHVSQNHLARYYTQLTDSVNANHRDIVQEAKHSSAFIAWSHLTLDRMKHRLRYISYHIDSIKETVERTSELMMSLIGELAYLDWYGNLLSVFTFAQESCLNSRLPLVFISEKALRLELIQLNITLRRHQKELAIPLRYLGRYYKLPLTSCIFSPNQLIITLRVPIKSV